MSKNGFTLTLVLIIAAAVLFVGYLTYSSSQKNETSSQSSKQAIEPTINEVIPTIVTPQLTNISGDTMIEIDNGERKFNLNFNSPSESKLKKEISRGISIYTLISDSFELRLEPHTEAFETSLMDDFVTLKTNTFGSLYRVQRTNQSNDYYYADNVPQNTPCTLPDLEESAPPCGRWFLYNEVVNLFFIKCTTNDEEGLNQCDEVVKSLSIQ